MTDVDRIAREKDVETLRKMAMLLIRENERLMAKVFELQKRLLVAEGKDAVQLRLEIAALQKELDQRSDRIQQHLSEKRPGAGAGSKGDKPAQTGHGPRPQPQLQIEEVVHDLDEADKVCTACGGALEEWEGQFEESDEVDVVERRFVLKRHKKKKYRCGCGSCIETAMLPKRLLGGGRYSAGFAIAVVIGKYLDHLPLERQVRQMARAGLTVDSQTLFDQCWALAVVLRPAYARLGEIQRALPLVFADETRWPLYGAKGQQASASKWHIWTLVSKLGVYYEVHGGRDTGAAEELLAGFRGYVMCDGYAAYDSLAKKYPRLRLVQCWAHVRRYFVECETSFPVQSKQILELIGRLYGVEERGRGSPEELHRLRQEESRVVLSEIQRWVLTVNCVRGSALHTAIVYMTNRWSRLTRFVEDPMLPLDNNPAERAMRGPVIGRKNHYGSRSLRGTEVAAICYSLLESCKLAEIDPAAYLHRVVEMALAEEPILLPHEIAAATAAAIAAASPAGPTAATTQLA